MGDKKETDLEGDKIFYICICICICFCICICNCICIIQYVNKWVIKKKRILRAIKVEKLFSLLFQCWPCPPFIASLNEPPPSEKPINVEFSSNLAEKVWRGVRFYSCGFSSNFNYFLPLYFKGSPHRLKLARISWSFYWFTMIIAEIKLKAVCQDQNVAVKDDRNIGEGYSYFEKSFLC